MKPTRQMIILSGLVLVMGCNSQKTFVQPKGADAEVRVPVVLSKGTDEEIRTAAIQTARADVAAGHPRICIAGGIAVFPVGVPSESQHLIKGLPQWLLPSGCTEPLVMRSMIFAEAYNHEILAHVAESTRP